MDKINLRKNARNVRKNLDLIKISQRLVQKISQDNIFINSKNVMLYYPTICEINLLGLMKQDKNFFLPRVNGINLEVCPYQSGDILNKSDIGIFEPITKAVNPDILDLIITPALMADEKGYRLGYGCGYYDRFLKNTGAKTICAIPKELFTKSLPAEEFDIPVDKIFTD